MDEHKERTGLGYDKVMVFPNGYFSVAALKALKVNNYLAAVNTKIHPTDRNDIRISDYFDLALSLFEGFPLFLRNYPQNIVDTLIGLFLGKPALLVAHHGYFVNEDAQISKLISQINMRCPDILWASLGDISVHSYLIKRVDKDKVFCRIYSNRVIIENDEDQEQLFVITKSEEDDSLVSGVYINDKQVDYDMRDGNLELSCYMGPKEQITVRILYRNTLGTEGPGRALIYEFKVFARRILSEFRDGFSSFFSIRK